MNINIKFNGQSVIKNKKNIEEDAILTTLRGMGVDVEGFAPDYDHLIQLSDEELVREALLTTADQVYYFTAIHDEIMDRTETPEEEVRFLLLEEKIRTEYEEEAAAELDACEDHLARLCWLVDYGGPGMPGWGHFLYLRSGDGDKMALGLEDEEDVEAIEAEFFEQFNPPWRDHPDLQ